MKEVNIDRRELLTAVRKNRAAHAIEAAEASRSYHEAVHEALQNRAEDLASGAMSPEKAVSAIAKMRAPVSHLDEYDRLIRMLEMSADGIITLQAHEFSQYVLDEWSWKQDFMATSAMYRPS